MSDFSDLSAKLTASLRVCARVKQVGKLHTETVNVFCVAHENYPVLFSVQMHCGMLCTLLEASKGEQQAMKIFCPLFIFLVYFKELLLTGIYLANQAGRAN